MPGLYGQPFDRRQFLRTAGLAGVAVIVQGCHASRLNRASNTPIHLALLSDTHVAADRERGKDPRGFDPWENLHRVVPDLITRRPSGVILNGDAASREGLVADYQELKTLLDPLSRVAPIYIGLGNHDHRENFQAVFAAATTDASNARVANHHVLVIDEGFMRFIMLDSLFYTNKAAGLLGERQRIWLTDYLAIHRDTPVVLFVHHTLGDSDGDLLDADRLFEILRPHPQVKAIFYGHSHTWTFSERQGVKLINLPSLGYNFWEGEPVGWVDARFFPNRVDLTLHAIAGNRVDDGEKSTVRWW